MRGAATLFNFKMNASTYPFYFFRNFMPKHVVDTVDDSQNWLLSLKFRDILPYLYMIGRFCMSLGND